MISQSSIDGLKQVARIEQVIGQHVELKKKGSNLVGKCPFHDENTPSFTVHPADQYYKCFGCGKSGDVFRFVIDHERKTFHQAAEIIAAQFNYKIELEGIKKEFTRPVERLEKLSPHIIKRFEERGISNNTTLKLKITESIEWMPKAGKEIPVVCFNYYRNGELVNIKYRGADRDFKLNKGSELIFYNIDSLVDSDEAIIVEGEFDCLSVEEAGLHAVVSVPNGASIKGDLKLEYLDNCWQYFEDKKIIYLFTDNDPAGIRLRDELARRLGRDRCRKVIYPPGCKDANEIHLKHGSLAITDLIDNAVEFPIEGIIEMPDMYEDVMDFYDNGYPEGITAGIDGFDDHLRFSGGQLTTVTGMPGSGKSEFIDFIMARMAIKNRWSFGLCSFENQPSALHVTKLCEKIAGKSFAFRHNPYSRMTKTELESAIDVVNDHFYFININHIDVTLAGLLEKAKELVTRKGIKGLLIDPWNYVEHKVPAGYTETQYISEALTAIKAFAIAYGVHVFLVAHPTKLKKEGTKYEVPTLYSISGSAHFFNKTDNGFTVVRDFQTNRVTIYFQKIRFSWMGKVGQVDFVYDIEKRQYITADE